MSLHLERDIENLQHELLALSAMVEQMVNKATRALRERDAMLAHEVVDADREIDYREVRIEEECLKMLALHQPVAVDLRRIATTMKVNNDLERVADLAVNIAQRALSLIEYPDFFVPETLGRMVTLATQMLSEAIDALVQLDTEAARRVCARDDEVDALNRKVIDEMLVLMQSRSDKVNAALHCFSATRHLERIADHATNIAEDVIYLVNGEITRHRTREITRPV